MYSRCINCIIGNNTAHVILDTLVERDDFKISQ